MKDDAHEQLLRELEPLPKTGKYSLFFTYIYNKEYSEALLRGCQLCDPDDTVQTELIAILLRYEKELGLDLNIEFNKSNPLMPLDFAIHKENFTVHFLLQKAGAYADPSSIEAWTQLMFKAITKLVRNENAAYRKESEEIKRLFDELPLKTDGENKKNDYKRIEYLRTLINHILKYHRDLNDTSLINCKLSTVEKDFLYYYRIDILRKYIIDISVVIANLSKPFRQEYQNYLKPISWYTFEHLGGINQSMKDLVGAAHMPFEIEGRGSSFVENRLNSYFRFFNEHLEKDELAEEAIPHIIQEFPMLADFFSSVLRREDQPDEQSKSTIIIEPLVLPIIKGVTRYFLETNYLSDLLNLTKYSDRLDIGISPLIKNTFLVTRTLSGDESMYTERSNPTTKLGKHAILRRLQRIGELLSDTKSDFTDFDPSIDFSSLITLRNGICHQDQENNKSIVDALLSDANQLEQIARVEMRSLYDRVQTFICSREKLYGVYKGDSKSYLKSVLHAEQQRFREAQEKAKELVKDVGPQRRISQQEEDEFMEILNKINNEHLLIIQNLEEIKNKCHTFFDGTCPLFNKDANGPVFNNRAIGDVLDPFAALRKSHKDLHRRLAEILKSALNKRTSADQRAQMRLKFIEDAEKRRVARESKFSGLETIRELAHKFAAIADPNLRLSPLKRIDAALEALVNMQEFLMDEGYLVAGMQFKTMDAWDQYHREQGNDDLIRRLIANYQLNDALEYNTGQLLQHLDTIRTYPEAQSCQRLTADYASLRAMRNYIEHGHPLMPSPISCINRQSPASYQHQTLIAPKIIKFIVELYPDLCRIKAALEQRSQQAMRPPSTSAVSVTSPLVAQSIFSSSSAQQSEREVEAVIDLSLSS